VEHIPEEGYHGGQDELGVDPSETGQFINMAMWV
jgi:hypothetical protein